MIELPEIIEPKTAYVANMRALWEHMPHLAQQVDRVDDMDLLPCEPTRSGDLTCKLAGIKGEPVYLHSRYDPQREAARWAEGVLRQGQAQRDKESGLVPMCYIVDGFGLGYHLQALFDKLLGEAFIIVSEPNLALIRTALSHFDYAEMIASDRLIVLTGAERDEIFKKLQNHGSTIGRKTIFFLETPLMTERTEINVVSCELAIRRPR